MILYFNPDCGKCREAAGLLRDNQCDVEIWDYLRDPPTVEEIATLLVKLGCRAEDIIGKSEPLNLQKFQNKNLSEGEWLAVLSQNPLLIERPILMDGKRAVIGRPPVRVLDLVKKEK